MKKSFIGASLLILLSGCNSDDGTPTVEVPIVDASAEYLAANAGQYQMAYEAAGVAKLARLTVSTLGATWVDTSDIEVSVAVAGDYVQDDDALVFTDGSICQKHADGFACDLDGVSVKLGAVADESVSIESLAGQYQVLVDNELIDIMVASQGRFSLDTRGCALEGKLTALSEATEANHSALTIELTQDTCQQGLASGVAFTQVVDLDPSTLEVYLPSSSLSGDWVKR